ncbi:MAG: thiosulfate oxidation carrier protein SoxY [Proteobacteria bacterium]|nr:thiosulfate oxidation carrier protein SoxY [Pseudomonadota bacterium]
MRKDSESNGLSRRRLLAGVGAGGMALAGAMIVVRDVSAQAIQPGAHLEVLNKAVGGKQPQAGKVRIRMPEIAENGNTVPITVAVDSPMTGQDFVKAVHVVTDNNPRPELMSVFFTPLSGKAEVSTRIRLAQTMNVIAYAEMSDGSLWSGRAEAKVTIGGCGG